MVRKTTAQHFTSQGCNFSWYYKLLLVNSSRGNKYYGKCITSSTKCLRPANKEAALDTETDKERWAPPMQVTFSVIHFCFWLSFSNPYNLLLIQTSYGIYLFHISVLKLNQPQVRGDIARALMYMAVCYGFQQPGGSPGLRLSDTPNVGRLNCWNSRSTIIFGFWHNFSRGNIHALPYLCWSNFQCIYFAFYVVDYQMISFITHSPPVVYSFTLVVYRLKLMFVHRCRICKIWHRVRRARSEYLNNWFFMTLFCVAFLKHLFF